MSLTEEAINSAYRSIISVLFNQLINAIAGDDNEAIKRFSDGLHLAKDARDKALSLTTDNYFP